MKKKEGSEEWLKAALFDKKNSKIVLLTSTNDIQNLIKRGNRYVKTIDGKWYIGHYRMAAPYIFWQKLKDILIAKNF